jgi:Centromere DNA-binding protein complex CBF3 subunit, domain 2
MWVPPQFPKKHGTVWERVFHPSVANWHDDTTIYAHKCEAVNVLFIKHRTFPSIGIGILEEFVNWCEENGHTAHVHPPSKVVLFLETYIAAAKSRWQDAQAERPRTTLVEECAVYSFRGAITHLDDVAQWQGHTESLLKTEELRVLQTKLLQDQARARAEVRDYAGSSRFMTKRLTQNERADLSTSWWNGEAATHAAKTASGREWAQVRGLLMTNLQRSLGRRGQDIRNIRLAMFFTHILPNTKPVTSCPVIGASLRHVKECHENLEHLLGWMRSAQREECPLGALAVYLVYMNDIAGPSLISIIRECLLNQDTSWHHHMLILGKDAKQQNQPISYTTHHVSCHAGLQAACIQNKTASTHLERNTVGCELIEQGMGIKDTGLYQGWYHDTAADVYLRGCFKTAPMLMAHGWKNGAGDYTCWWEDPDESRIPTPLITAVFPGLDELITMAETQTLTQTQTCDRSVLPFLRTLKLLRRIFLEDALCHQTKYSSFPAYARHPIFCYPSNTIQTAWYEWQQSEFARMLAAPRVHEEKENAKITQAVQDALTNALGALNSHLIVPQPALPIPPPPPMHAPFERAKIPDIRDPIDLYTCYDDWVRYYKPYFMNCSKPPWKEQFGATAHATKIRFCHLRPYFNYVDDASQRTGLSARAVIDRLDAIRKEKKVTAPVFIKYCIYALQHHVPANSKKPPAIMPDDLRQALCRAELPT